MSKVREGSKIKRSPGDQAVQVLIYIFVGVCAVVTVLPFLYVCLLYTSDAADE